MFGLKVSFTSNGLPVKADAVYVWTESVKFTHLWDDLTKVLPLVMLILILPFRGRTSNEIQLTSPP